MRLSAGTRLGPYEILTPIGAGGMGEVYRARDDRVGRDVAIKVSAERFSDRFELEARAIAALNHPNICHLYDVGPNYLVMELIEGEPLAGPLPVEQALEFAQQIADALEAAHEKGIVHRDLKPANIKVKPDGTVKVLDFGLAKTGDSAAGDAESSPTMTMSPTRAGMILGTAPYMSPEQARGKPVDRRTDIWAFGVVLYEMLTGDRLFQGETITDVLASVVKEQPDVERVPEKLRPVLRACLQKDPKRRLQAIGDWRLLLGEEVGQLVGQPAPSRSRLGVGWIAAAVFALAFAALSLVHFRETTPQATVVRFQVPVPEGAPNLQAGIALSPDGRQLAFVARKANIARQLWVRALDSLETRPLAGTEGAIIPFWSPDGRFLAFIDGELRLKRIALSGGLTQTLCRLPAGSTVSGDWARDGVILVGGADGLFRVPAAGGDPVRLTAGDQAAGELTHAYPQVLPDGAHYLYLSVSSSREKNAIYLGSWDGKLKKRLVTAPRNFRYAPPVAPGMPGHLLFLREETLMAQPFDPKTLGIEGEAIPVAERVGTGPYGAFTTSENGVLAYYPRAGMAASSQPTWFDRSGKPSGNLGAPGAYNNVALSRDGARAAVVQASESAGMDIWLIDVARGIPTRFTFNDGGWDPTWSPDGSRLAYAARTSSLSSLAFKLSSGAEKEEQIPKAGGMERPCDWSPDGGSLMYTRLNPKTGIMALWVLSGLGGDPANRKAAPYLETQFHTTQCQFSPDGHWVAYTSNEAAQGSEVYVQAYPAGPDKIRISSGGGSQPRWRRDGKELFYMAPGGKLMAVDVKTAPKFQALIPHLLFDSHMWFPEAGTRANDTTISVFRYDVTPDGKHFLVNAAVQAESGAPSPGITVVLNWAAGLNK